jgi:hypothetical protein
MIRANERLLISRLAGAVGKWCETERAAFVMRSWSGYLSHGRLADGPALLVHAWRLWRIGFSVGLGFDGPAQVVSHDPERSSKQPATGVSD